MSNKIWYVEATGHTNEVIAGELPAENAKPVLCIDGVKRPLWLCDYRFIKELKKNRRSGQLVFKVWYREGRHGPVRKWPFLDKKKPTLASALKKGTVTVTNQREGP
jgi:hypothetical protein